VPPVSLENESVTCFVEIPKGSRNKYEWDEELGGIKLDRLLFSSIVYPTDYGFIPKTWAEDEDPLDVLVCVSEPTFPGCVIEGKPLALFKMSDEKGPDHKILCVPCDDPTWSDLESLEDLPKQLKDEITHFFSVYKDLEQKTTTVEGWFSREDALQEIEECRQRFNGDGG